ncbi:hypothetical protein BKA70DRAFT_1521751 [Coprinopsis sp. MPI-PUGE-AT-0042]|nr:hypothetical protein BKA70DRAFT_1521751 [Coprinopsis sp. MPI-PUGE-AT-0042]
MPLFNLLPKVNKVNMQKDLTRWKVYAHHVCTVILEPNGLNVKPPSPSAQALARFIAYIKQPLATFVPALQHLHFRNKFTSEELICLTAITPPSLEGFRILAPSSSKVVVTTALQYAAGSTPKLKYLELCTIDSPSVSPMVNITHVLFLPPHCKRDHLCYPPRGVSREEREACNLLWTIRSGPTGRPTLLSGDFGSLISANPAAVPHGVADLRVESKGTRPTGVYWEELLDVISISCSGISGLFPRDDREAYNIPLRLMALDNLQKPVLKVECNVQATRGDTRKT